MLQEIARQAGILEGDLHRAQRDTHIVHALLECFFHRKNIFIETGFGGVYILQGETEGIGCAQ